MIFFFPFFFLFFFRYIKYLLYNCIFTKLGVYLVIDTASLFPKEFCVVTSIYVGSSRQISMDCSRIKYGDILAAIWYFKVYVVCGHFLFFRKWSYIKTKRDYLLEYNIYILQTDEIHVHILFVELKRNCTSSSFSTMVRIFLEPKIYILRLS